MLWTACDRDATTVRMIFLVPLFSLPMNTETAEGAEDATISWSLLLPFWESYIFDCGKKGFSLLERTRYQLLKVYIQRRCHQLILCALLPFSWQWKMRAQHMLFASIKQLFKNKLQAWICQRDNANSTGSMASLWLRVEVKSIHFLTSLQILTQPLIADDLLTDSTSIGNVWLLSLQLRISNRTLNVDSRCYFSPRAIYVPHSKINAGTLPPFQIAASDLLKKQCKTPILTLLAIRLFSKGKYIWITYSSEKSLGWALHFASVKTKGKDFSIIAEVRVFSN